MGAYALATRLDPAAIAHLVTILQSAPLCQKEGGRLDIAITEVGSLADVPGVHQLLAEGRGDGKYVVRLQG